MKSHHQPRVKRRFDIDHGTRELQPKQQTSAQQNAAPPQFSRPVPLTSSERVQRTRNRKKKDLLLVTLEIRASERAALIRRGFLAPDKARDKQATRDAIYAYLETVLDPSHATTVRNTTRGYPVTREQ